jgi:multiple sugar transport system substrate-binding protein
VRRAATGGLALVLALSAALAGCTDESEPTPPEPTPSATSSSPAPEPQTLRFSVYGDAAAVAAYRAIADSFEADNPGVTVVLRERSDAAAAAEDAFADLSSPEPEQSPSATSTPSPSGSTPPSATPPDVFLLDQHYLPDLVSTGRLHPLDIPLEEKGVDFGDDFQRIALTAFSAEAALQCMPFEMSPTVLFYNTRLVRFPRLADQGIEPPDDEGWWRFEDFAATARRLVDGPVRPGFKAVHLPADADLLAALLRTADGDIVDANDEPSTLQLDSDAGRETLTAFAELARDRSVTLTARQALRRSPVERFGDGQLAFLFGTRADVPALRAAGVRFDVMSLPRIGGPKATTSAISGLCVDADSEVRDLAVEFVAHAVSQDSLTRAARSGSLVPASLDVVNSPAFVQEKRRPRTVTSFLDGQKRSVLIPYSLGWRLAETRIEELMAELAAGTSRDLAGELDQLLPAIDEESQEWFEQAEEQAD